jgi:hypothetical protein
MKTITSLFLSAFAATAAHAVVVDFNGPAYPSSGNLNGANSNAWVVTGSTDSYTLSANGGLNNSQEVRQTLTINPEASAFYNTAFDASLGAITVSTYFRYSNVAVTGSGGTPITLGFAGNTTTSLFTGGGPGDMILARINKPGTNTGQLTIQTRVSGTGSTPATGSLSSFALTNGNWYFLTSTLTRTGTANQFSFTTSISNASSDGTIGSLIDSIAATTLTSAALYADDSLFAGFRGFASNGLGAVDNFAISQIPEPSAFAALAGLGVLGLAASRRRRRA